MELQENSSEYMYKDGMLSEDTYSFDNADGTVYAGEARTTGLRWDFIPESTGTIRILISWNLADVMTALPALHRDIVGILPSFLPVMTLLVR